MRGFCGLGNLHLKGKYQGHTRNAEDATWPKCLSADELVAQIKSEQEQGSIELPQRADPPATITIIPPSDQAEGPIHIDAVICASADQKTPAKSSFPDLIQTPDKKLAVRCVPSLSLEGQTQMAQHVLTMNGITEVPGKPLYVVKSIHGDRFHLVHDILTY